MIEHNQGEYKFKTSVQDAVMLMHLNKALTYNPSNGTFTSIKNGKIKYPKKGNILQVATGKAGGKTVSAPRAAWLLTYGTIPQGKIVKIIDGDHNNLKLSNLELVSFSERNSRTFKWNDPAPIRHIKEMIGKTYGYLTIIGFSHSTIKHVRDNRTKREHPTKVHWVDCKCICGKEVKLQFYAIDRSNKSCGCDNGGRTRRKYTSNPIEGNARDVYKFYRTNNPGDLSFEQFLELSAKPCNYCGAMPSNVSRGTCKGNYRYNTPFIYSGLDRVNSAEPHNYNNCVPCCYTCNLAKSDKSVKEFEQWIRQLINYQNSKGL